MKAESYPNWITDFELLRWRPRQQLVEHAGIAPAEPPSSVARVPLQEAQIGRPPSSSGAHSIGKPENGVRPRLGAVLFSSRKSNQKKRRLLQRMLLDYLMNEWESKLRPRDHICGRSSAATRTSRTCVWGLVSS